MKDPFLIAEKFTQQARHMCIVIDTAQWLKLDGSGWWYSPKKLTDMQRTSGTSLHLQVRALIQLCISTDWFRIFRVGAKLFNSHRQTHRLEWSALQWILCASIWTL